MAHFRAKRAHKLSRVLALGTVCLGRPTTAPLQSHLSVDVHKDGSGHCTDALFALIQYLCWYTEAELVSWLSRRPPIR